MAALACGDEALNRMFIDTGNSAKATIDVIGRSSVEETLKSAREVVGTKGEAE